ncbi:MAG: hypothetical protein HQK79_20750 [Desulfobacterales bacterium]|nr:hypothetical protein [Desulfobacterales bacterium]
MGTKKVNKPKLQKQAEEETESELKLFNDNIDLIITYSEVITSKKEFFYIELPSAYVGTYISGSAIVPLGLLITLWRDKKFTGQCKICGDLFLFIGGGGGLSGAYSAWGICSKCKTIDTPELPSGVRRLTEIQSLASKYSNFIKITKSRWEKGLVGEPTDDEVVREKIGLEELINHLKTLEKFEEVEQLKIDEFTD